MINIETTQSSFLLRYAGMLTLVTEILTILTMIVMYTVSIDIIMLFAILFFTPLLSGIIASKIVKRNKKVLFKKNYTINFILLNIILYTVLYFLNYTINIYMFSIYISGALLGMINSYIIINKIRNKEKNADANKNIDNTEENLIKKYKMEKFDAENIKKFLELNKLKDDNYFIAQIVPKTKDYFLYGMFSFSKFSQYIVHFDDEKLYFFELSRISNKSIENSFIVYYKDMKVKKIKSGILNYIVILELDKGNKAKLQILKKIYNFYAQEQYSKKLIQMLNKKTDVKNKKSN